MNKRKDGPSKGSGNAVGGNSGKKGNRKNDGAAAGKEEATTIGSLHREGNWPKEGACGETAQNSTATHTKKKKKRKKGKGRVERKNIARHIKYNMPKP